MSSARAGALALLLLTTTTATGCASGIVAGTPGKTAGSSHRAGAAGNSDPRVCGTVQFSVFGVPTYGSTVKVSQVTGSRVGMTIEPSSDYIVKEAQIVLLPQGSSAVQLVGHPEQQGDLRDGLPRTLARTQAPAEALARLAPAAAAPLQVSLVLPSVAPEGPGSYEVAYVIKASGTASCSSSNRGLVIGSGRLALVTY